MITPTLKPATRQRVHHAMSQINALYCESDDNRLMDILVTLLKEQDLETCHACAQAVLHAYSGQTVMTKAEIIAAAHTACMNTQAI